MLVGLALAVLGGAALAFVAVWIDEARRPRLVCLLYHRFASAERHADLRGTERVFTIPIGRFEAQLEALKRRGYHFATAREAVEFVGGQIDLPQPAVHVTIDDGARSVREMAEPALRRHGARATLFLTTDPNARVFQPPDFEPRLTDDELRALDPAIVEVQCHGVSHRPLCELDDVALREELTDAREHVRRIVGGAADCLAIPGNWHDGRVLREAARAGYAGVFVSDAGGNRRGGNPLRIRRLNVEGHAGIRAFDALLTPFGAAQIRLVSAVKRLPGRVLGPRRWLPIRARIRAWLGPDALSFRAMRRAGIVVAALLAAGLIWWLLAR